MTEELLQNMLSDIILAICMYTDIQTEICNPSDRRVVVFNNTQTEKNILFALCALKIVVFIKKK